MSDRTLPGDLLPPIKKIVEAALLVSPEPLTVDRLQALFGDRSIDRKSVV